MVQKILQLLSSKIVKQLARFGAIGFLNTAVDFLSLNLIASFFSVEKGLTLGGVNIVGFVLAVTQGYFYNRSWTFQSEGVSEATADWKNVVIEYLKVATGSVLGVCILVLVFFFAHLKLDYMYYVFIGVIFVAAEVWLYSWIVRDRHEHVVDQGKERKQFLTFILVSVGSAVINSLIVAYFSEGLSAHPELVSPQNAKNAAKAIATVVTMVTNFIGYKFLAFKEQK